MVTSLSVADLKGAVLAVGGGSRGGPGLRPFSLCVGFCSEGELDWESPKMYLLGRVEWAELRFRKQ